MSEIELWENLKAEAIYFHALHLAMAHLTAVGQGLDSHGASTY